MTEFPHMQTKFPHMQTKTDMPEFNKRSEKFFEAFFKNTANGTKITTDNRAAAVLDAGKATPEEIQKAIDTTRPIAPKTLDTLATDFINYKIQFGSDKEKAFYPQFQSNLPAFYTRLLEKRPLVLVGPMDNCVLRPEHQCKSTFAQNHGSRDEFDKIGTLQESGDLTLENYLSYEEMELSARLGISSFTVFLNDGNRNNGIRIQTVLSGQTDMVAEANSKSYEKTGILMGVVGPRFERPERMDWKYLLVTSDQNTKVKGYGKDNHSPEAKRLKHFAGHYDVSYFPTYEEAKNDPTGQFVLLEAIKGNYPNFYLNTTLYKKRMAEVFITLFEEANARVTEENKRGADLRLPGLSLGAWGSIRDESGAVIADIRNISAKLQLELLSELLSSKDEAGNLLCPQLEKLQLIWWSKDLATCPELNKLKEVLALRNVRLTFADTNPAVPIDNSSNVAIVVYPWDSGSFVANEFWGGAVGASSDPAAGSCSLIIETQNPKINPSRVCGENLQYYQFNAPALTTTQTMTAMPEPGLSATAKLRIDKAVEAMVKIAEKPSEQQQQADALSLEDAKTIKNSILNISEKELDAIQRGLAEKGIAIKGEIAKTVSAKSQFQLLADAILDKRSPTKPSAPAGMVQLNFFERSNYDYFSVTAKGDAVCTIPFTSHADGISSENTCKTGELMKLALTSVNGKSPLILQSLEGYLADLRRDFYPLGIWDKQQIADMDEVSYLSMKYIDQSENSPIQLKIKRFLQLKRYEKILKQIVADPEMQKDLCAPDMADAKLPQPVRKALATSNAVSFLITPQVKGSDSYVRLEFANLFSLERDRIGKAKQTSLNPKYPSSFAVALRTALTPLQLKLQQKKPKNVLTEASLITQVTKAYLALANITINSGEHAPIRSVEDIKKMRQAIINVLKAFSLDNSSGWEAMANAPYRRKIPAVVFSDKPSFKHLSEGEFYTYLDGLVGDCVVDALTVVEVFPFILSVEQQEILRAEVNNGCSFFDEIMPRTLPDNVIKQYNELIQIFLATACIGYYEYTNSNGLSSTRLNFGSIIEGDPAKQASLITEIKKVLEAGTPSLEDAMLNWLEANILSMQPQDNLKKFKSETRSRIKKLFKDECGLWYNVDKPAPHVDEFLFATSNKKGSPQVVTYRGTMALPLDVYCENYDAKPWLKEEFKETPHAISLPKASQIAVESGDGISVCRDFIPGSFQIDVREYLKTLDTKSPIDIAKFLLQKTAQEKSIYSLLDDHQVNQIMSHKYWIAVSAHALQLLSKIPNASTAAKEQSEFKEKFKLKLFFHLTRELEHQLYAWYGRDQSLSELSLLSRAGKIQAILKLSNINVKEINKTGNSTHVIEFSDLVSFSKIEAIFKKNNNCLHITPEIAGYLYRSLGESAQDSVLQNASVRLASTLAENSKFPLALKMLFPDLCCVVEDAQMPPGKTQDSSDVIIISFNKADPQFGYQITASNPDNLNRIRDHYESSMTHVLSSWEAGKILQLWAELKSSVQKPVTLNETTLEKAMDELGIIYASVVEVGSLYQIQCDENNWERLKAERQKCTSVNSNVVNLGRAEISPQIVEDFFASIAGIALKNDSAASAAMSTAKQLLSENPGLLNATDKKYQSTPLLSAVALSGGGNIDSAARKRLLAFCSYLIQQPGLELTHIDRGKNTVLQRLIFYRSSGYPDNAKQLFEEVALVIWEKARQEGTQKFFEESKNNRGDTLYSSAVTLDDVSNAHKHVYDNNNSLKQAFARQNFWNTIRDTRYYNIQPALDFLKSFRPSAMTLWYPVSFYQNLLNERPDGIKKFPLQMAIEQGNVEAVRSFLEWGSKVDQEFEIPNSDGLTQSPLELTFILMATKQDDVLKGKLVQIETILKAKGADVNKVVYKLQEAKIQLTKQLKKADKELNQAKIEAGSLNIQHKQAVEKRNAAEEKIVETSKALASLKTQHAAVVKEAESKLKALEAEMKALIQKEPEVKPYAEEKNQISQAIDRLKQETATLMQQEQALLREIESLGKKRDVDKDSKLAIQNDISDLVCDIRKAQKEKEAFETQLIQIETENSQAGANLLKAQTENQVLKEQAEESLKGVRTEHTKLKQEHGALEKNNGELKTEKAKLTREEEELVVQRTAVSERIVRHREAISTQGQEEIDTAQQLQEVTARLTRQCAELTLITTQQRETESALTEVSTYHAQQQKALTLLKQNTQQLEADLNLEKQTKTKLEQEKTTLTSGNARLTTDISEAQNAKQRLETKLEAAQKENETKTNDLKTLQAANKQLSIGMQQQISDAGKQAAERALSTHFFKQLAQNPEYRTLVSRIGEIEKRIDPTSWFQDATKNKNKADGLREFKKIIEEEKGTFTEAYDFINAQKITITQSTRKTGDCFTGGVTSLKLFNEVIKFFATEDALQKAAPKNNLLEAGQASNGNDLGNS
jgi:hypothetical protein